MDFHLSFNWLKEFVAIKNSPETMAECFQLHGASVERVRTVGDHLQHIVLGAVRTIEKHPNADRLRLVEVEIGDGRVGVVCGADNVKVGMKVAFATTGAKVKWHGAGELVELQPTKIRGVLSRGMICAAAEIGLVDAWRTEDGIMDLSGYDAPLGTPLKKVLKLDDTVLDVEITTNRPDMMSVVGLAREASAITGAKFLWKEPKARACKKPTQTLAVEVKAPELCSRYTGIVLENIHVAASPDWLKNRLALAGIRSINNVVDVTNYVLLELGQPLHAFAADKLSSAHIIVRRAKAGESIEALDGKTYSLTKDMLVIADEVKPIAMAGVMGGSATGVGATTTTIILEGATFDPISVRKTARALQLHSDSSQLFEKGLPGYLASVGLWRAVELLEQIAGARVSSRLSDVISKKSTTRTALFDPARIRQLLGIPVPDAQMKTLLKRLGFKEVPGKRTARLVPWWRGDIAIVEDLAEEVARLIGYHTFPARLPEGELIVPPLSHERERRRVREFVLGAGYHEVITYSFVSRALLEKSGLNPEDAIAVENPLNDDFTHLRSTLVPGALQVIQANEGQVNAGRMFEIGRVFSPSAEGRLPLEAENILLTQWQAQDPETAYRALKGVVEQIANLLGITKINFTPNMVGLFHPGRTAQISINGEPGGYIGELHPRWRAAFGLNTNVFMAELDLARVLTHARDKPFSSLPSYPPVKRDLAFVVDETVPFTTLLQTINQSSPLVRRIELFDIFRGGAVPVGRRSLAVHIEYRADDRTLTEAEIAKVHGLVAGHLRMQFGAEIRE